MNQLVLKRLSLTNFKSFVGQHTIDLDTGPGLFYVTGQNKDNPDLGANGIGKSSVWDALMYALWDKTVRDNRPAAAILPWGLESGQTKVALTFERHGQPHTLTRTRRSNSLTLDGRDIEQTEIAPLLGMGEDIFRRTVILGQFGSLFLDLAPEQQARMFNEALDLNLWLRASDHASRTERDARTELIVVERSKADLAGRESEAAQSLVNAKESERSFIADQKRKLGQIESLLRVRVTEVDDLKENPPANPARSPSKGAKGQSAAAMGAEELSRQRTSLREAEGLLATLGAECRAETATLQKLQRELNQYRAAQKSRTCPECGQKVTAAHLNEKVADLTADLEKHETASDKLAKKYTNTKVLVDDCTISLQILEKEQQTAQAADQKYQSVYNAWQLKVSQAESAVREAQAQIKILKTQTNPHTSEVERLTAHLEKLKANLLKANTEYAEWERQAESAKFWTNGFKEIRLSLVDDALQELEIATNRHAEQLGLTDWRIAFSTERETQSGNTSYKFSVWLYPPDQEQPVKFESYSGGESQRWQLACAFGLEEVLLSRAGVTCNTLILDEPTRGLSANGVEMLLEHLKERAHTNGQAIYFVDHHSLDRGAFDGTMWIEKTDKGSRIVRAVQ